MMVEGLSSVSAYQGQGSSVASVAPVEISVAPVEASPAPEKAASDTAENSGDEMPGGGNQQISQSALKKAVEQINAKANSAEAIFGIHEETNRVTIKMVDKNTKEVIREFPAEETLDLIAKAWELAGIMVDEKR